MSKNRIINTRFWVDDYISNLDPVEKLLFLYFLTNPATDISGVYEIPLKTVATDTGIEHQTVARILKRFSRDNKIYYSHGWVGIKNFIKHQAVNPKVQAGIKNGLAKAPKELIDRLCIDYDSLSHSNSNPNHNSNNNGYGKNDVDKPVDKLGVRILSDGTRAKLHFGTWVDANDPNVKIDLGYYPELTK